MVARSNGKNDACSKVLISNLLHIVNNSALLDMVRQKHVSGVIVETAHTIEKSTSDGPLEMIAGSLTIQVKLILGFK